jgi:hypothetical protein
MGIDNILGQWVENKDMHPATNIAGRDWMTKDGEMSGTFYGRGSIPIEAYERGLLWHFPNLGNAN